MSVGRKPVPRATKELYGNPGKRPLGPEEPTDIQLEKLPDPPDWLGSRAVTEWHRVGPYLVNMGLLTHNDLLTFAAYCANVQQMVEAVEDLREQGYTIIGARGITRNPALTAFTNAVSSLRALAAEFGMTPSSRARIRLPEDDGESLADLLEDGEEDIS